MQQGIRGVMGAGLALGLAALPAAAQGVALAASDPVGIARSGVQVAYGYSLEAATLNPALLSSLRDARSAYVAAGMELQGSQVSLESNQKTWYSADRNRGIAGFGAAFRVSPALTLGLKLDTPFQRHGKFAPDAPNRFMGDTLDLSGHRLEAQAAWAITPGLSFGVGLGATRLRYESGSVLRLGVPLDPTQPASAANPVNGVVEQGVGESASKTLPSYSLGIRWALNPRWTLGLAHQSGYKTDLGLAAGLRGGMLGVYANDGTSAALLGTSSRAATLLGLASGLAGNGRLELPSMTTLGVRQRVSSMITWEGDLRWTAAGLQVPGFAQIGTPSGMVATPASLARGKAHLGGGLSAEVELGKFWTLRAGAFMDQTAMDEARIEPLLGGSRQATFSVGAGYRVWGGEVSFGYQYRQSKDQDVTNLDGVWSAAGFRATGSRTRVEGMGHLFAIGFKRSF
ncbi:MAG TPA: outer membrane protein transport protein [Holophagaceae bacterium]